MPPLPRPVPRQNVSIGKTDIAINDFSFDCTITDATVTTTGWPSETNWTGQFKDDALAVQGYTQGNRIRGGTVHLESVQATGGAACIKLSGTSDVIVSDVVCHGHSNSLTIDYSQYTGHPHSEIIVSNLIGLNPVNNGLNVWGSGFPAHGVPPYSRISIVSPILTQQNRSRHQGIAGAYLCYADGMTISNALITGFATGVTLDSGPHPTNYSLSYLGGHIRDVQSAFSIGNVVWEHTRISEVTITNANYTAVGNGRTNPFFGPIFEYNVTNPRPRSAPPPPPSLPPQQPAAPLTGRRHREGTTAKPELMLKPMMGWNGWLPATRGLTPYQNNETLYYAAADQLVKTGLRDIGYNTIGVTCNGWQRDPATSRLRANPKMWPRGYKAFVDYAHARGLKVSAYAATGKHNCCPPFDGELEPGSLEFEELDVDSFAEMGVDGIGLDNCALPYTGPAPSTDHSVWEYRRFHEAWLAANTSMNLQIWDGGFGRPSAWAPALGHMWRTGPDCGNRWDVRC